MAIIGKPISRIDGVLKVTGAAKYAAEFNQKNMLYAFPVRSTIGKGVLLSINTAGAEKSAGVLKVITYLNAPRLKAIDPKAKTGGNLGEQLVPFQDKLVHYFEHLKYLN